MDNIKTNEKNQEEREIDLLHLLKVIVGKWWLIVVATVICAVGALAFATFLVTPKYSSNILLYVNNKASQTSTPGNLSSSDISTSRSLVDTYKGILKSRTTLEDVIEKSGAEYDYKQLSNLIKASAVDNTELLSIVVTANDAEEAYKIAHAIAEVLPEYIQKNIDGTSMRVVDDAKVNPEKVSPNRTTYTLIGAIIGFAIAVAVVIIIDLTNTKIRDKDYLTETFNAPVLATIPNLMQKKGKKYYKYGYGYGDYGSSQEKTDNDNGKE